jgi:hypothetical protein
MNLANILRAVSLRAWLDAAPRLSERTQAPASTALTERQSATFLCARKPAHWHRSRW